MATQRPPREVVRLSRGPTSAEVIEEARQRLCLLQQLRPLNTRRPETPQEESRRLFRQNSARDLGSRPSSGSYRYHCASVLVQSGTVIVQSGSVIVHLFQCNQVL